jgi:hypothetical protein
MKVNGFGGIPLLGVISHLFPGHCLYNE